MPYEQAEERRADRVVRRHAAACCSSRAAHVLRVLFYAAKALSIEGLAARALFCFMNVPAARASLIRDERPTR